MRDGLLKRYMEVGFPYLRQVSGLPEWLVPDITEVARKLGDKAMLKVTGPLGLSDRLETFLAQAPEADSLPSDIWQRGIASWQPLRQVLPVMMALLRACEKVDALERRGVLRIDFASLVRSLATICYAPFAPNGSEILSPLAGMLGGSPAEPAALLKLYVKALENGNGDTLASVEECILQNPAWAAWSERLLATGKSLKLTPRVIGVSPVSTGGLIQLLAAMIVEVINADHSRDTRN